MFVTILDTATAKYSSSDECASLAFNFLSCSLRRFAERASTSFLDARGSSFFFIKFTSSWSLKVFEQFVGYNNVRCVLSVCDWWNRNYCSMSVTNFHSMNFQNWSNSGAFLNSCQILGLQKRSRNRLRYWKYAFSHKWVRCISRVSSSELWSLSGILFPEDIPRVVKFRPILFPQHRSRLWSFDSHHDNSAFLDFEQLLNHTMDHSPKLNRIL